MKHIKKFESKQESIQQDYIEMCFVDFIDEGNFKMRVYGKDQSKLGYEITFNVDDSSYRWKSSSVEFFQKCAEKRLDFFNRLQECLSKIKIQYPDMKYHVDDASSSDYNHFRVHITSSKDQMQFNPTGWF